MNELSLFSGYGGFSLGLRLANLDIRTVGYVEIEPYCQELLRARIRDGFLDWAPIIKDIRSADFRPMAGLVDILSAGFPCQPHSHAGQRKGSADDRNLWPDTLRCVIQVRPKFVFLENVRGILSSTGDGDMEPGDSELGDATTGTPGYAATIVGQLADAGYDCEWGIVSASDVGAPHQRARWWCIGVANTESQRNQRGPAEVQRSQSQGSAQPWEPNISGAVADSNSLRELSRAILRGDEQETPRGRETSTSEPSSQNGELADSSSGRYGDKDEEILTGGNASEHGSRQVDDSQHNGQSEPQDTRGTGPRVHSPRRAQEPEQSAGPGISATRRDNVGNSDCQPTELVPPKRMVSSSSPQTTGELAESTSNGLHTSQSGVIRKDKESSSPREDATEAGRRSPSGQLADTESIRRTSEPEGAGGEQSQVSHRNSSRTVAHADSERGPRRDQSEWTNAEDAGEPSTTQEHSRPYPIWPPGPSDTAGWARLIGQRPDLAPALTKEAELQIRGTHDGSAHRVDRIRAIGNGISPPVVRLAWESMMTEEEGHIEVREE
jgi:DNA (cytosine-5)-methyltransferase 1